MWDVLNRHTESSMAWHCYLLLLACAWLTTAGTIGTGSVRQPAEPRLIFSCAFCFDSPYARRSAARAAVLDVRECPAFGYRDHVWISQAQS